MPFGFRVLWQFSDGRRNVRLGLQRGDLTFDFACTPVPRSVEHSAMVFVREMLPEEANARQSQ